MIALISPWIISFSLLMFIASISHNPWHPLFVFLYTLIIVSFVILPIYTIYSSFFAKNSPSLKEAELNPKIDEILKKTESKAVIEKREALEKQQAIWDAEIQQFTDENNERQETLACINQEIAVLTSYIIPFLPKKKLNK